MYLVPIHSALHHGSILHDTNLESAVLRSGHVFIDSTMGDKANVSAQHVMAAVLALS